MRSAAGSAELLVEPAIARAADGAVVEVGLGRVDPDDADALLEEVAAARPEELLEVHVADVARVVVAGDDQQVGTLQALDIGLRQQVLLAEAVVGEVARDDDHVGPELVDLDDGPLHEVGDEERRPGVQVGDLRDHERAPATDGRRRCVVG